MRGTDSTRTATRWLCCSTIAALLGVSMAACTTTTRYFVPSEGASRLNTHDL
jgi:hypothetical protein